MSELPVDLGAYRTSRELEAWRDRKRAADAFVRRVLRAHRLRDELMAMVEGTPDASAVRGTIESIYGAQVASAVYGAATPAQNREGAGA